MLAFYSKYFFKNVPNPGTLIIKMGREASIASRDPFPDTIWASSRENLSSGFPTKRVSNQSPQLQRLARKLKFHL